MFTLVWMPEAEQKYRQLADKAKSVQQARKGKGKKKASKEEGLFKQVHKAIEFLKNNPKHPGLETHEYSSIVNPYDKKQKVFEAYAQNKTPGAYRIFWCYGPKPKEISLIAITPHP
jgi:hypothetical protein